MSKKHAHATVTVTVGGNLFILQHEVASVWPQDGPERYIPATVVREYYHWRLDDEDGLEELYREFSCEDDVWTRDFLEVLIPWPSSDILLSHIDTQKIMLIQDMAGNTIQDGPYVIHSTSGRVFSLLKLFSDPNNAFVRGVIRRDGDTTFDWLEHSDYIPVPSRLQAGAPNDRQPLRGLRFGVKDSIDVAGLETGCGSACRRSLYPPLRESAPFVKQLLDAGAVMVGKMRLCQWCDGQDPLERLEEATPTNPRGDAFQKPSGSSSGSAAGAASYPWLDFTIGTDTGGSVRHPAGVNGLYGVRPSHDSVGSAGLVCSALMDTPGVFARSAVTAQAVSRVMAREPWRNNHPNPNPTPTNNDDGRPRFRLLYAVEQSSAEPCQTPKFFPPKSWGHLESTTSTKAGAILEAFVQKLELHLGCKREETCIYDLWRSTRPQGAGDDLANVTATIYQDMVYHDLAHDVIQPFVRDYQAATSNKTPFIEAVTRGRIDYGAQVSPAQYERSVADFRTYAAWVNEVLLPSPSPGRDDDDDDTIPLLIYPQAWGVPRYRDEPPPPAAGGGRLFWSGFSAYSISYCSGCPDVTVPVGEVPFRSKITGASAGAGEDEDEDGDKNEDKNEFLPVALSVLAPRGADAELLALLADLEGTCVLSPVECGRRLSPGGR
ncbi:amidase signature domain-containing protein [Xylariaceae sp. FL0804]|nr:amidase signature domain-containing protein [Xylariaceae sp. FL0804]